MLVTLLGYDHLAPALRLNGALPGSADALVDGEALCTLARERRLDLRAARARVTQAAAELQLQHGLAVKVFSGGINVERDDDWALGPAIRLEVPIFDQNQAQIAKAVEALAQHEALLRSTEMSAVQEVASALARTQAQWDVARVYEDQVSRTLEALELSRQSFEVGKTTILPVIEAQRKLLSARRMHAVRLQAAAAAVSDLERATGAPREELLRADASNDRNQP
jgi:cobalt-zinc-cadmium efflux system outer membrane protein